MKRLSVLLLIALLAGLTGGCGFALIEGDSVQASLFSAQAEGNGLFDVSDGDLSYLYDEPVDMTPPPAKGEKTTEEDPPFEEPVGRDPVIYVTPAPTRMPHMTVTPEPTPEPTPEIEIGLHSQDTEDDDRVSQLQARLKELGYLEQDQPDGHFGSRTLKALMRFQEDNGLEQTGVVDSATSLALLPEPDVTTAPDDVRFHIGAKGKDVERVQERLRQYGFLAQPVTGEYDEATYRAVMAFQQYAVEFYGTEYDEPRDEPGQAAEPSAESDLSGAIAPDVSLEPMVEAPAALTDEDVFGAMPVLEPEATLRPDHPLDGLMSENLFDYLEDDRFPTCRETVQTGDSGTEVARVQRRLITLEYFYDEPTGNYDDLTAEALRTFQARNDLQQTGIADAETQSRLFSEKAVAAEASDEPFYIKVSLDDQRVYVYRWFDGGYNELVKCMICSTGIGGSTPRGTFVSPGHRDERWHYFVDFHCWAQYAFVIKGNILFHSVLYSAQSEDALRVSSVKNLGHKASHGCVRLKVADARWIYEHCGEGQVVEIY